jgi:hypothetical protein
MAFRYLQLLFPVLVVLHNTEEAIGIPNWARRSGPWFGGSGFQPAAFRFVVTIFTVLALVITVLSSVSGSMSFWGNFTFGSIIAMLINSIVPHIAVSIAKRTVMPGVITAVTLNLPILSLLAASALKQGYV